MNNPRNKQSGRSRDSKDRRGRFRTDTEISKNANYKSNSNSRFTQQQFDEDSEFSGRLEDIGRTRERFDQFEVNRDKFGHKSTYQNDLYTTSLDKDFYKKNEKKAEILERGINKTLSTNKHVMEERGARVEGDEESRYSSVNEESRSPPGQNSIPPQPEEIRVRIIEEKMRPRRSSSQSSTGSPVLLRSRNSSTSRISSPRASSPLNRSLNQLHLDMSYTNLSEKQKDEFSDFIQKENEDQLKKVKEELTQYRLSPNTSRSSSLSSVASKNKDGDKSVKEESNKKEENKKSSHKKSPERQKSNKKSNKDEKFSSDLDPHAEAFIPPTFVPYGMPPPMPPPNPMYPPFEPVYYPPPMPYYPPPYQNDDEDGIPNLQGIEAHPVNYPPNQLYAPPSNAQYYMPYMPPDMYGQVPANHQYKGNNPNQRRPNNKHRRR